MDAQTLAEAMKKYPCAKLEGGMYRTCPVRLSFPHLFVAQAGLNDDGTPGKAKYSVALLFPAGANIDVLRAGAKEKQDAKFGADYKGAKLHTPFRDQGDKGHLAGYEEGRVFISANSTQKPGVVAVVGGVRSAVTDPTLVYAGCWALVTLRPYDFTNAKKKGVSFGLGNVMKLFDDEPFSTRSNVEDDFGSVSVTSEVDPASLF